MANLLADLNEQQVQAVTTTEGHIRIIACAGSGKTRALAHRFAYLVNTLGISPANILCVTFTNKAAGEMKKRIRGLIGHLDLGRICTFHSFCVQLLREDCHIVQYPSKFVVLDEEDVDLILKECFTRLGITSRQMTIKAAREYIESMKSGSMTEECIRLLSDATMKELLEKRNHKNSLKQRVLYEYLYEQRKAFGFDFDDLINFGLHVLKTDSETRTKWQQRLEYIMVDEFQDVSQRQYELARILSDYHQNLFVVGDPDQTIYSWRGADVKFILEFNQVYPDCTTIIMDKNYRSLPGILAASNALIKKNKQRIDKSLQPNRVGAGRAVYYHAKTQAEEADWVAKQIIALKEQGKSLAKIALLYRAHYVSRTFEEAFVRSKIPYVLYSGIEFYRRKEVKDVLCYLRLLAAGDDLSFIRVINEPKRGIGKKRMEFIREFAASHNCSLLEALASNTDHQLFRSTSAAAFLSMIEKYRAKIKEMTITDVLAAVMEDSGYEEHLRVAGDEERLDNLAELKQSIYEYETTAGEETDLESYLEHIALFTNLDLGEKPDSVKLMTVHAAKGLEFPCVFVCGMSEGVFPSRKTFTLERLEEERRLAYVAFTRAEDHLFITDAAGAHYDGSFRFPSRFIFNAEKVNLDYVVELPAELIDRVKTFIDDEIRQPENDTVLPMGSQVTHEVFGCGTIIDLDPERSCYTIQFEKFNTPRSIHFNIRLTADQNKETD